MNNVKVAMSALTKMSGELSKLSPEDALPSWWTNKVAIAVDKLDGMADYLDTQVEVSNVDKLISKIKKSGVVKKGSMSKNEEVELDEGTWHIAKNMNALKKKMQKPIFKNMSRVKFVMKHIGDDELTDAMFDAKTGTDMVPMIKSAMKRLNIKEEVDLDESGHTDVASAMNNVKVATSALTKMSGELSKLSPEDALPSWWTNKVAVAVDKLDGMADYLDTQVEETDLDEAISGDQYYYVDPKGVVAAVGNKDAMRKMNMKQAKDGNKGGSFSQNLKKYKVGDKIKEEADLDEASKEGTIKIIKNKDGKFQIQKMTKGKFVDIGKPHNSAKEAEKFRSGQPDMFGEQLAEIAVGKPLKGTIGKVKKLYKEKPKKEELDLDEGKMAQMHQMMKDKKSAAQIAKEMGLDVKTVKALMDGYNKMVPESFEIGTEKYLKHTVNTTPGQKAWTETVSKKAASMRETLAKMWGVDEGKNVFEKDSKKDLTSEVKGGTTMTGKKVADIDIKPTIKEKKK
jgi:hypothetical protein